MIKVLLIGLGWQGKKFLNYFDKIDTYKIYGSCKTLKTKEYIESMYGIEVFLNYREAIERFKPDLIIVTVFPTKIQYSIVKDILINYNTKILIDLPISFNINELKYLLNFKNLYVFNIEFYTKIFKYINEIKFNITNIRITLLVNKSNLLNQNSARLALAVDKFYCMNNLVNIDYNLITFKYLFINRKIRDIEYLIEIISGNNNVFYKFYDGKGILFDINKKIIFNESINYDSIISKVINRILNINKGYNNRNEKYKHIKLWKYILNK